MELNNELLNSLFILAKQTVSRDLAKYNYNSDIKHLLYIIIPAFIIKYNIKNQNKIINTFKEVPITIINKEDRVHQAYYTSIPSIIDNKIKTQKYIAIKYYSNKSLLELIDNIIHEYNHAINSIINEISIDKESFALRTGLTKTIYPKKDRRHPYKDDAYILEEIINTKQTEEIVDIINSFNNYNINDQEIVNTLYSIRTSINKNYSSNAYYLQASICKELMNNKTLISVLSNMRFNGNIDDIPYFFDNITGIDNSYNKLISILHETIKEEEEYTKTKWFKSVKLNKIRSLYKDAKNIIDTFNANYHFK